MARTRKTWQEKLAEAKAKTPEPRTFLCNRTQQHFVIPTVDEVEHLIRRVPRGRLVTIKQMMDVLRERHGVDVCCPITTGIFTWIIAHAADELEQAGRKRVIPWWRIVKASGELNPRYPGEGARQREKLRAEGHRIISKAGKPVVADLSVALVGRMRADTAPRPPSTNGGLVRKVLRHDDFGLCLLLPKTAWPKLPARGPAKVELNGAPQRVTVHSERCNCRGTGWHEHRFLSLPRSTPIAEHDRVTIQVPQ